jgi:alpha-beta hydrolase superfamily lysophospholipase
MSSSPGTAPSFEGPGSTSGAPNRSPGSADAFSSLAADVPVELAEGFAEVGDVKLHYVEAGDGPLVVLLHGFPEFWYGWRLQIAPLAAAGFRVVAPDLRGYNLSSKPDGVGAYGAGDLAADVRGLIEERGAGSAFVVGHDWVEPPPGRSR